MVNRINDAISAYNNAASRGSGGGMEARDSGPSFGELVRQGLEEAVDVQRQSEAVTAAAVVGKADLTDVVTAVNNAELTLQTVVAVRDKVIGAYQEIMRMPI